MLAERLGTCTLQSLRTLPGPSSQGLEGVPEITWSEGMEAEFVGVAALALTPTGLGPLSRTWPTSAKGKRPRRDTEIQPGSTLTRVTCGIAAGGVVLTGLIADGCIR
eukprot:1005206-Amphidinium_carterae.1